MMSNNDPVNFKLVYTSTAIHDLLKEELISLLEKARSYNNENFVTGVLLYKNSKFLQVLEGDKDEITKLFDKIKIDPRHEDVTVIYTSVITHRVFPDWSMGLSVGVENEDFTNDPSCFNLVSIIPFCIRSLYASNMLIKTLIKFLDS